MSWHEFLGYLGQLDFFQQAGAVVVLALFASVFGLPYGLFKRRSSVNPRHLLNRKRARYAAKHLRKIKSPQKQMAYLREINPYVFEELLLDAFESKGYRVTRSARYSGDGGIDGTIRKGGRTWLIQAKRYSGHIQSSHVADFARIVEQRRCHGLFCHTGRTGRQSHSLAQDSRKLTIVSGDRLLDLLIGKKSNW